MVCVYGACSSSVIFQIRGWIPHRRHLQPIRRPRLWLLQDSLLRRRRSHRACCDPPPHPARVRGLPPSSGAKATRGGWRKCRQGFRQVCQAGTQAALGSMHLRRHPHGRACCLVPQSISRVAKDGPAQSFFNFFSHGSQDLYPTYSMVPLI